MDGVVELPADTTPLSPQEVFLAVQAACSQQQTSVRAGTAQLQAWESQPGYYPILQVSKYPNLARLYVNRFHRFEGRPSAKGGTSTDTVIVRLLGQEPPKRSPLPRCYPIEKWHGQVLEEGHAEDALESR